MLTFEDAFGFLDARIKAAEDALTARQTEIEMSDRSRAYAQLSRLRKARAQLVEAYKLEPAEVDGLANEFVGEGQR